MVEVGAGILERCQVEKQTDHHMQSRLISANDVGKDWPRLRRSRHAKKFRAGITGQGTRTGVKGPPSYLINCVEDVPEGEATHKYARLCSGLYRQKRMLHIIWSRSQREKSIFTGR